MLTMYKLMLDLLETKNFLHRTISTTKSNFKPTSLLSLLTVNDMNGCLLISTPDLFGPVIWTHVIFKSIDNKRQSFYQQCTIYRIKYNHTFNTY